MLLYHAYYVCIFLTPLSLGILSFYIGLFIHSKKEIGDQRENFMMIYSILFGLLMFPYVITFIPIMVLVLIPGIFNHNYYLYVFISYVTVIRP